MSGFLTKRGLAAALCAAMLCAQAAPAAEGIGVALAEEAFSAAAFSLSVETTQTGVSVSIAGADNLPITVGAYNSRDERVAKASLTGSGRVELPLDASGNYYVKARYDGDTDGALVRVSGRFMFGVEQKQEAPAEVPQQTAPAEEPAVQLIQVDVQPVGDAVQPESDAVQPESDAVQPESDAVQPESNAVQPVGDAVQPESDAVQPVGDAVQPVGDTVQPVGDDVQEQNVQPVGSDTQVQTDDEDLTISASVSVSGDAVSVTVTQSAADRLMGVMLGYDDVRENVRRGETVTFSGLSAGTYEIEIDYMDKPYCPDPFTQTVTVQGTTGDAPAGDAPTGDTPTGDAPTGSTPSGDAPTGSTPADPIAPGTPTGSTPAAPTQFEIEAGVSDGEVFVKITDAVDWELEARLLDKATGDQVGQTASRIGSGQISLGKPPKGSYIVTVSYVTPAEGIAARVQEITIDKNPETPAEPTAPTVAKIEASVETGMDFIAVTVTQADNWQLYIAVDDLEPKTAYPGDTVRFTGLEKGRTYEIEADYVNAVSGVSPFRTSVTLPAASAITATAKAGVERIDVSVTAASALPVMVTLMQGGAVKGSVEIAASTGAIAFTGIPAGEYTVSVDYKTPQVGVSPTVISGLNVLAGRAAITDLAAVAGENQLSITGFAQPNTDVTLTTKPASATAIVRTDRNGSFTTTIVCAAGTYTAVYAQYGTETDTRVTLKGTFEVTAPAVKPTLEVDPIANNALTVIARTTPGVKVNLSTGDYAQTVTADANGLMRYSLPHTYPTGTVVTFTVKYGVNNVQSYQQTVKVGEPTRYILLRRGASCNEVYWLTQRLRELGYPVSETYRYTDSVVAAVRLFQRANGLAVDGMAGQATQTALYSLAAVRYGGSGEEYPTLVRGDRGLALIYTLQQRLKDLGYYSIRVDGIYGSGTQRAVRWFQQVNGLTATGTADSVTQRLLYSSDAKPASGWSGGSYTTLSRSNRYNARVVTLQRRLKALGYLSGSVDGYFGTQTYRAVRSFQSRNGLSVTGVADAYTQEVLYSASAKAASGSSSSGTSGYRLLYWGCQGEAVRRLQQALLDAGYTQVKRADGIYGQWTYDAVRAFQKDRGLAVDGIAGRNTQNALYGTSY